MEPSMHAPSPEHPAGRASQRVPRRGAVNYLSVCSGVGSDSLGFDGLGWTCVGVAEVAPFPSAVLAHRYLAVRNFGDFTKNERSDGHARIASACRTRHDGLRQAL